MASAFCAFEPNYFWSALPGRFDHFFDPLF